MLKFFTNDPRKAGQLASRKAFFGDYHRFAIAAVHTRFDDVEWFVWDAEDPASTLDHAEVVRQSPTITEALEGLEAHTWNLRLNDLHPYRRDARNALAHQRT